MNKVVHFELPVEDKERAKSFYGTIFDWQMNAWDPNYTLITTVASDEKGQPTEVGGINGGLALKTEKFRNPLIVVDVQSIDDILSKVELLGGSVVSPKIKIENIMYYARIMDSEGNVIGLGEMLKHS